MSVAIVQLQLTLLLRHVDESIKASVLLKLNTTDKGTWSELGSIAKISTECNLACKLWLQNFVDELEELNIYDKLQKSVNSDPEENYHIMLNLLSTAKEKHLPKKMVKFDKRKHEKTKWMTNGLLRSINNKDRLYKKLIRTDMDDLQYVTLKNEFTVFKNTLRRSINEAKRLYYLRTFALYKNDMKQTWSVIKDTLQRKLHSSPSSKFILNNNTITDLDEIATEFNKYFITIG